jgi:hypothetical protein
MEEDFFTFVCDWLVRDRRVCDSFGMVWVGGRVGTVELYTHSELLLVRVVSELCLGFV